MFELQDEIIRIYCIDIPEVFYFCKEFVLILQCEKPLLYMKGTAGLEQGLAITFLSFFVGFIH